MRIPYARVPLEKRLPGIVSGLRASGWSPLRLVIMSVLVQYRLWFPPTGSTLACDPREQSERASLRFPHAHIPAFTVKGSEMPCVSKRTRSTTSGSKW